MLTEIQEQALAAVEADPNGHLRLGLREMIWAEFGPRATSDNYLSAAHRQRIALAVAGVRHVLPLWQERYPDSDIPTMALSAIEAITQGGDASDTFDELWEAVMDLSLERPFPEIAVGFAAVQALRTAMYDEFFDADDLDPGREDGDDPESFDSAYYAAIAAAHGQPADPESDSRLRLEFWKWWLTDAIDSAKTAS
ncbi:MAG TPA: Imm5 family immunity protein [Pyrinomonadaceae bacterium]|nr:Imm5 family immunity protein [Pyrinomonadaceae bacterium]